MKPLLQKNNDQQYSLNDAKDKNVLYSNFDRHFIGRLSKSIKIVNPDNLLDTNRKIVVQLITIIDQYLFSSLIVEVEIYNQKYSL